ncbi:MAG: T9SS type A sorting domain-containing protein [Bacteroidetes bacterium]|nr:T9SS type A sorting domain-containing protein [Bacteroidota bacterium]
MRNQAFIIFIFLFINGISTAQDAPITWIGSENPCQPTTLIFPVIDTNFISITAISLRLEYNPQVMSYDTFMNVNPQLSGLIAHDNYVNDTLHKIMIVWSDISPKTLPDGAILLELEFVFTGGGTTLYWNNTVNGGSDCEYSDENGDPLVDTPSNQFYKNGFAEGGFIGNAGSVYGNDSVCEGSQGVEYWVDPITNATTYNWTVPAGASIVSGAGTNRILVNYGIGASDGIIEVYGSAGSCIGTPSPPLWITVKPELPAPVIVLIDTCLVSDYVDGNQWYNAYGLIPGATAQQFCPEETGDYYAVAFVDGCISQPSNVIHVEIVGVLNNYLKSLMIYPNPVESSFVVQLPSHPTNRLDLILFKITGREVFVKKDVQFHQGISETIVVSKLAPGIYILKLNNKTIEYKGKLIIK